MPHRKNASTNCVKNQSELTEELEETPVYIKPSRYGEIKHKIAQPTFYHEPHLIKSNEITAGITRNEYESRRKRLFRKIPLDSCLILASNPESKFSSDGRYSYRQQSDFNYFTGLQESDSIAAFTKDAAGNCKFILFLQPIIKHEMCWHGHRCGLKAAIKYFGAHESFSIGGADKKLYQIMEARDRIYFDEFVNEDIAQEIKAEMKECKKKIRLLKPRKIMQQIRLVKSTAEVALIRKSVEISALSMIDTMQFCGAGLLENELSVQFEHGCKIRGAARLSYECSVASGLNAVNLSYFNNNSLLHAGDLCLIDCGCEYNGYSSDITRTFPVNGVFDTAQRELYEMVLSVSTELISMMKVGCTIKKLESQTAKLIKKGLKELGITSKMQNVQIKELKLSCADVHFVAHFIGLDIHDTSDITHYQEFEANMVLAIEPAVYLPDHPLIPPKYRGIGIRIEDDVLITANGAEILSKALPRSVQEIESYMRGTSMFPRIRPLNLLGKEAENKNNSGDLIISNSDLSAANTLSCIRSAAKKKEEIEQESLCGQYDAIKLFQQAIYECEQAQSPPHKRNKPQPQCQPNGIDAVANDTIRRTRSGKGYRNVVKAPHKSQFQLQPQSQSSSSSSGRKAAKKKKKKKRNGRIPKLSNSASSPFHKSANVESQRKAKAIGNAVNSHPSKAKHSGRAAEKKISKMSEIVIDLDVDSNINSSPSCNSIMSSDTCNFSKSSHSTFDSKKKKSLYSSPTSQQLMCSSRKRKREEMDRTANTKRQSHSHKIDRKKREREREPAIKRSKLNKYHGGNSNSYRYKYNSNDCYPYYNDYKYHNKANTNTNASPYYNDMLYAAFYPPYVNQNSSKKKTARNTQSAYDSFMAKSNDKI